jgi:heme/copper-type cytochrome/quinol oxidase subunit 3
MATDPLLSDPVLSTEGAFVHAGERASNLRLGSRLFVVADAFIFLAFAFAYLYLRTLNTHGMWHPKHISPSTTLGALALVTIVGSGVSFWVALRALRLDRAGTFRGLAWLALALILAATVIEGIQTFDPGFSPSAGGGYGSVFVGFTAVLFVHLLAACYWLETVLVASRSLGAPSRGGDAPPALSVATADAYCAYGVLLAAVIVVAFLLFYVV